MDTADEPLLSDEAAGSGREHRPAPRPPLVRFLPLAVVVLALGLGYAFGLHRFLSLDALRAYDDRLSAFVDENAVVAALAYVAVYVLAVALSFPGASVLTAAGGLMFGFAAGTVFALLAATIGATCIFLIARTSLGDVLASRAGPRLKRLRQGFQEEGFLYLLFLRLVPLFPFWLVNLAAALFGVGLAPFVAATAIGCLPGTLVLSYFGEGLGTALGGEVPEYWVEAVAARIALLALAILLPVFIRRWRRRHRGAQGAES